MKRLWKTLLVTLLVVSMLSGMVTAFAAENTDPAEVAPETEAGVDATPAPAADEADPDDSGIMTASAQSVDDSTPIVGDNAGNDEVEDSLAPLADGSEPEPASEPVSEPAPEAETTVGGSCGVNAVYAEGGQITSGTVLAGSKIVVTLTFVLNEQDKAFDELTGTYTVTGAVAEGDNSLHPIKAEYDGVVSIYQDIPLTVTAEAGGMVSLSIDVKGICGGMPVEFTFRPANPLSLTVINEGDVKRDTAALEDALGKVEAVLGSHDSRTNQFANGGGYTSASTTQVAMRYNAALLFLSDPGADQAAIDAATQNLTEALDGLVEYKKPAALEEAKAALQEALDRVHEVSDLSPEAQNLLAEAEATCANLLYTRINEGEKYNGTPYDEFVKNTQFWTEVVNNIADKQVPANKDDLSKYFDYLRTITLPSNQYTEDSWSVYADVHAFAQDTLDNPFASQNEVDDCLRQLREARNGLVRALSPAFIEEVQRLLADNATAGEELTGDNKMAFERAQKMLTDLIAAYNAGEETFKSPEGADTPVVDRIADALHKAFTLSLIGKMPADRTELKAALEAAKQALEEKKDYSSNEAYKELENGIADAEYVIDYKSHPDATLRLPDQLSQITKSLKDQTEVVLKLGGKPENVVQVPGAPAEGVPGLPDQAGTEKQLLDQTSALVEAALKGETPAGVTEAEAEAIASAAAKGQTITTQLVARMVEAPVDAEAIVKAAGKDATVARYVDAEIQVQADGATIAHITQTEKPIELAVVLSQEELDEGLIFFVVRSHEGETDILPAQLDGTTLRFSTDKFSSFGVAYTDDIAFADVEPIPDQKWTGSEVKPSVKVTANGRELKEGTDYELKYEDNIHASDKAKVIVTGKAPYTGSQELTFKIVKATSANGPATGDETPLALYVGLMTLSLAGLSLVLSRKRRAEK